MHRGQSLFAAQLRQIILDAVFIAIAESLTAFLIIQLEKQTCIHHRLLFKHILKICQRDMDICENIPIRPPGDLCTCGVFFRRFLHQTAHIFPFFKVELIAHAIPIDDRIHKFRSILGGTSTQTIQTQAEFIVFTCIVLIFPPCVKLTENQFPVETVFLRIIIHRDPTAMILHQNRLIFITDDFDLFAKAFPCLVDGIGKDLKKGVFTPIQAIGTKNDPGAQADTIRPLQGSDAFVIII